jgi:hypothetical protein
MHHRGGDRDAAPLLDLHPVRMRALRVAARLDGIGDMNGAAEQQQPSGERGRASRLARSPPRSRSTTSPWPCLKRPCPQPATGRAPLSGPWRNERPSLFRPISAANAAQSASIEAKMQIWTKKAPR